MKYLFLQLENKYMHLLFKINKQRNKNTHCNSSKIKIIYYFFVVNVKSYNFLNVN